MHKSMRKLHTFVEALLVEAARGFPSRLEDFGLEHRLSIDSVDELTRLFKVDALPRLTRLSVSAYGDAPSNLTFMDDWRALGSQIKLSHLNLSSMISPQQVTLLLDALADPDFCPFLRSFDTGRPNILRSDAQAALETRRRKHEARAAAEGAAAHEALV